MTTNTAQHDRADREDDRLMTVGEICAELGGLSRRTFYRWREIGSAPQCLKSPTAKSGPGAAISWPGWNPCARTAQRSPPDRVP